MKRIIIFILVLSLLAVPVAADSWVNEFNESTFNVLEYCTPDGGLEFTSTVYDNVPVVFDFENTQYFSYVDILLSNSGSRINGVTLNGTSLEVYNYGNGFYRLYGYIPFERYNSFDLIFDLYSSSTSINFQKFIAVPYHASPAGLIGSFHWERGTYPVTVGDCTQSAFRDSVFYSGPVVLDPMYDLNVVPWKVFLTANDWNKYDYLTFLVGTDLSIDSFYTSSDFGALPFTVSEVSLGNDNSLRSFKAFSITVDISNYPKNSEFVPTFCINASQEAAYPGSFYLYEVLGSFDFDYESGEHFYLRKLFLYSNNWWSALYQFLTNIGTYIQDGFADVVDSLTTSFDNLQSYLTSKFNSISTWISDQTTSIVDSIVYMRTTLGQKLNNILSAIEANTNSNNQAAEDFNNSVETQADELQDMSDVMNSVERPDISDVNLDVSDLVDPNQFTLSTVGFSSLLGMDIFTRIIIMALTFALIGFVLFGKR